MKAVISSTYDDQYFFFLPITTWLWNKLGVDVICFLPEPKDEDGYKEKRLLVSVTLKKTQSNGTWHFFSAPEHKQATYAQCSRLFGACLDMPEDDEILITSDIDMGLFKIPRNDRHHFVVVGMDLVPTGQVPMCYLSATKKEWKRRFEIGYKSHQQCLDEMLGHEEMLDMRGNLWSRDQEHAANMIFKGVNHCIQVYRARQGTQFADHRIDRDDAYFMDRLSPHVIDYHFHRPGYTDENIEKIISVIQYFYPNEDLTWIREYQQKYKILING